MKFEMEKERSSIIKVIGVGGGGGNAVNHMYNQGIKGVDFLICNTDAQALELSPIPTKIQLGASLREGLGAGSNPEVGRNAAIENIDEIKEILGNNTKMVFITAGMGGGTGTGASPIIAQAAKELGILTVGIITTPFSFEGKRRRQQADDGLAELKKNVDAMLVISNDKLRTMFGNLTLTNAFSEADDVLTTAAKGIAELITVPGKVNVDFEDVKTVMIDSGVAIMGSCQAEGEDRAKRAVMGALSSPLLDESEIEGARYILLNITSGTKEILMDEVAEITDYIQEQAGQTAEMIWGHCYDESLGENILVTIIATGFQTKEEREKNGTTKKVSVLSANSEEVKAAFAVDTAPKTAMEEAVSHIQFVVEEKPKENESAFDFDFSSEPVLKEPSLIIKNQEEDIVKRQVSIFDFPGVDDAGSSKNEQVLEEEQPVEESFTVEEQLKRSRERILKLKELSIKLRNNQPLTELENVPAYVRKNRNLQNVNHSSESEISRFTLSEEEGITEIRPNNSFLHDNVD